MTKYLETKKKDRPTKITLCDRLKYAKPRTLQACSARFPIRNIPLETVSMSSLFWRIEMRSTFDFHLLSSTSSGKFPRNEEAFSKLLARFEEKYATWTSEAGTNFKTPLVPNFSVIVGSHTVLIDALLRTRLHSNTHLHTSHSEHYVHELFLWVHLSHFSRILIIFFPAASRWFAENKSMNLIPANFFREREPLSNWQLIVKCRFVVVHMPIFRNNAAMSHETSRMPCAQTRTTWTRKRWAHTTN